MSRASTAPEVVGNNSYFYLRAAWATAMATMASAWFAWAMMAVMLFLMQEIAFYDTPASDKLLTLSILSLSFTGFLALALGLKIKQLASSRRHRCAPAYPLNIVLALAILFVVFIALPSSVYLAFGFRFYCQYLLVNAVGFAFYLSLLFGKRPYLRGALIYLFLCISAFMFANTGFADTLLPLQDWDRYKRLLWVFGFMVANICMVDYSFRPYLLGPIGGSSPGDRFSGFRLSPKTFAKHATMHRLLRWHYGLLDWDVVGRLVKALPIVFAAIVVLKDGSEDPLYVYGVGVLMLSTVVVMLLGMVILPDTDRLRRMYLQSSPESLQAFLRRLVDFRFYSTVAIFSFFTISVWIVGAALGVNAWFLPFLFILGCCWSITAITWIAMENPLNRVFAQALSVAGIWLLLALLAFIVSYWQLWHGSLLQYGLLALLTAVSLVMLYKTWVAWGRRDIELTFSVPWIVRTIILEP